MCVLKMRNALRRAWRTYIPNSAASSFFCWRDGCVSCLNTSSSRASSAVDKRCRAFLLDIVVELSRWDVPRFVRFSLSVVRRVLLGVVRI